MSCPALPPPPHQMVVLLISNLLARLLLPKYKSLLFLRYVCLSGILNTLNTNFGHNQDHVMYVDLNPNRYRQVQVGRVRYTQLWEGKV
jgi:hypothetical protein